MKRESVILIGIAFFMLISIFTICLVSAENLSCTKDSDCEVSFTHCGCTNKCFLKSQNYTDCTMVCAAEMSNTTINSCKCEDNKCVGKHNKSNSSCKNLYWFDNDNKECRQKEFCGVYMYRGLETFESKTQCEKALNETDCIVDDDCPSLTCIGCTQYACKNGKCKELWGGCEVDSDCTQINCVMASCPKIICINKKCETERACPEGAINENGTCKKTLSNGRNAKIKLMPETASQRAIERLGELNFTIQLKEVRKDKIAYELIGNKEGKFLGIFKIMARVKAQVDAETGDVKVIKPWWSFLASGI